MSSKSLLLTGRIISTLVVLLFLLTGTMAVMKPPSAVEGMTKMGYSESLIIPIGLTEIACALLYAFPPTSILGGLLLTAYLGGAVATHAQQLQLIFVLPIIVGILVWLGLLFREPRLRALLPLRMN